MIFELRKRLSRPFRRGVRCVIGSETVPVQGVIVFARGIPVPFVDVEQWADRMVSR